MWRCDDGDDDGDTSVDMQGLSCRPLVRSLGYFRSASKDGKRVGVVSLDQQRPSRPLRRAGSGKTDVAGDLQSLSESVDRQQPWPGED